MFRENLCSTELKWMEGNAIDMETIELIVVFVVFVLRGSIIYVSRAAWKTRAMRRKMARFRLSQQIENGCTNVAGVVGV